MSHGYAQSVQSQSVSPRDTKVLGDGWVLGWSGTCRYQGPMDDLEQPACRRPALVAEVVGEGPGIMPWNLAPRA